MKIFILAKTKAKERKVQKISENSFQVSVPALPVDGQANREIVEVLADYFGVSKSSVRILSGAASKKKLIYVDSSALGGRE